MSLFAPARRSDIARLIGEFPLAWIVSRDGSGLARSVLPLLAECDLDGEVRALFGHIPKASPHAAALVRDSHVTALFTGPQGYVSPELVSKRDWGPTWNFATASFDGELAFVPLETDASLIRLAEHLEGSAPGAWTVERMGARYQPMRSAVAAFRIHVSRVEARFKLGQDESEPVFAEIVTGHPDATLTRWMRDARQKDEAGD